MFEFVIPIPKLMTKEQCLARIAQIIDWQGEYQLKDSGYEYMIGTSNDWFMETRKSPGVILICYRYGLQEFMLKLQKVLIRLLNDDMSRLDRDINHVQINFFVHGRDNISQYLNRIANIIYGSSFSGRVVPNEYMIDDHGHWWVSASSGFDERVKTITVGCDSSDAEFMSDFREVLMALLDVKHLNEQIGHFKK